MQAFPTPLTSWVTQDAKANRSVDYVQVTCDVAQFPTIPVVCYWGTCDGVIQA